MSSSHHRAVTRVGSLISSAPAPQLIVKVAMADGGSRTLMVDERQTVREVLDKLFEKTHCDRSMDWSLCEANPELQIGVITAPHTRTHKHTHARRHTHARTLYMHSDRMQSSVFARIPHMYLHGGRRKNSAHMFQD